MTCKSKLLKTISGIMLLCCLFATLEAQDRFSLDQAVEYALEHKAEIKKAYLNIEDAESQIKETRAIGYPKLNGTAGYQRYLKLPTSILPGSFQPQSEMVQIQDINGTIHDLNITTLDENGNPIPGDDVEATFGTKHQLNLGLSFQMLLFDGSYIVGLQTAKMYREFANIQVSEVEYNIKENVTRAFYNLLIVYESQDIVEKNIKNAERILNENQRLFEEGLIEKLDVDRIRFSLRNLVIQENNLTQLEAVNKNLLKFNMGYPLDQQISIEGSIDQNVGIAANALSMMEADQFEYANRPEYNIAQSNRDISAMNIKRYKYSYLPTLSFSASYNQTLQGDKLSTGTFFPSSILGLNMNIPIYDGRDKKSKIERAEITVKELDLDISELERSIDLEIRNAEANLKTTYESYILATENVELATNIYNTTLIKYQEGVGSSVEVSQAESDQYSAQNQLVQSEIDLIKAKIDLDKATGNL